MPAVWPAMIFIYIKKLVVNEIQSPIWKYFITQKYSLSYTYHKHYSYNPIWPLFTKMATVISHRNWWKIRVNHLHQYRLSFRSVDWIMLIRNMTLKIQYGRHIWKNGRQCLDGHKYVDITIKYVDITIKYVDITIGSTKFTWRKSLILYSALLVNTNHLYSKISYQ